MALIVAAGARAELRPSVPPAAWSEHKPPPCATHQAHALPRPFRARPWGKTIGVQGSQGSTRQGSARPGLSPAALQAAYRRCWVDGKMKPWETSGLNVCLLDYAWQLYFIYRLDQPAGAASTIRRHLWSSMKSEGSIIPSFLMRLKAACTSVAFISGVRRPFVSAEVP